MTNPNTDPNTDPKTELSTAQFNAQLPQDLQDWLAGRRIDEVECVIPDMVGTARGKAMPVRKFRTSQQMHLSPSMFFQTISGEYVEIGWEDIYAENDMVMVPDISTARAVPWAADPTIQVISDLYFQSGKPVPYAPRNVLKAVLALYEARGWRAVVAPEIEFYVTKPNLDPNTDIEPPVGRTGRQSYSRQAYSISGVDEFGPVVDDIYDFAEAQGLHIDTIIREDGAGQLEINLRHGDPLELADEVFNYKRMIREAALRHDCYATFMAKPIADQPGSAMHIHQSVVEMKSGQNIFSLGSGKASAAFGHFIGGLQTHLPSVLLLFAPYVNSYRRLVPQQGAPINLDWGRDNRTVGLREPVSPPAARRIENRVVGMDANPYLAIAATLACGYLGLKHKLKPRPPVSADAYELPRSLPRNVLNAVELFEADTEVHKVLGQDFCELYAAMKRTELDEFMQVISPWERQHLMLTV